MPDHIRLRGFTLVEMAIVMAIIGLLIGGIIIGRALVNSSEVQATAGDISRYTNAVQLFNDKYKSLPGDMPNATALWGYAHVDPATCNTTASIAIETCDGSGDGTLGSALRGGVTGGRSGEVLRFWQHLSNAGMITGNYSGVWAAGNLVKLGVNIPRAPIGKSGFSVEYWGLGVAAQTLTFNEWYRHALVLGGETSGSGYPSWGASLTTEDALAIDTKLDDGRPGYGNIQVFPSNINANCYINGINYRLTTKGEACAILIKTGL